ncbi:MAG: ABC transporter substrate-binding protein [Candidatus Rokuibacteriota bacterium]|nr:MAG: ABC transporter substrate-binding protein [Candidatus Rokubacteria bacterium]
MSDSDRWRRLRHAAMAVRVGVLVLLAFLSAPGSFVSGPVGDAHAQQQPAGKVYRIGFLSQGQPPKEYFEALQQGLRERGYVEGRNLAWEFRSTDGSLDQLPQFAEDLVRLKVDVILARASSGAMAAKRATTSIPIVFFAVYAPVEIGLVPNLGHPGGNITGVAVNASDMAGKRVQLFKELVPRLKRVAMLSHPPHPTNAMQLQGAMAAARTLGVHFEEVPVRGPDDFASALKALRGIDGVLNADNPFFVTHRVRLVDAVAGNRLPAIYPHRIYVEAGGLMSYGPNILDLWRRAAAYVDKILKGAKPGDLPVEQPTTFELVINNKTAKAIRLTIPPSLVSRADQIVE